MPARRRFIAAGLAAGAALATTRATFAAGLDTVTIGLSPTDVSSGPLYADACGAFARNGIAAVNTPYLLNNAQEDVERGTLDIGFSDITTAITIIERGAPLAIIAPAGLFDVSSPVNVLIAPKDRPVRSGSDLNGKKIALPRLKSLGEMATRNWMDKHGGNSATLGYVELPFIEFAKALNDGRVDAAPISEPLKTLFAPETSLVAVSYADIAPRFMIGVFVARKQWIKDKPDLAARFKKAIDEASVWANANQPATATIVAEKYKIAPGIAARMTRVPFPARMSPGLIQPVLDVAVRYGYNTTTDAAALLA